MPNDMLKADATELGRRVRAKEVSPRELVDASIAAIEAHNPTLNALVHPMFDKARAQAEQPVGDRIFEGVPFVFKDLDGYLKDEPMHMGSRFMVGFVPTFDTTLFSRMKATGINVVGKTATPEFGIMGTTEPLLGGPCRNPWNTDHSTGGSSGGSASLVAARAVPMGHAGDGGGSIRIPAAHCGLFGIKPTRGRNPLGPDHFEGWGGYVQPGVVSLSVRDSANMLDATHGTEPGAPYRCTVPARPFIEEVGADPGKLRIAFTTQALMGNDTHADNVAAVQDAVKLLQELGHEVVESAPPIDKPALVEAYFAQIAVGVAATIEGCGRLMNKPLISSQFEPATWLLAQIGNRLSALELHNSRSACQQAGLVVDTWFNDFDVFLTPTTAFPPVRIGELSLKRHEEIGLAILRKLPIKKVLDAILPGLAEQALARTPNTMLFNQTGHPGMNVPLHWSDAGLPIGTQFVGRFGDEASLFRLAAQLEQARPWKDNIPTGF
jgi:amidase